MKVSRLLHEGPKKTGSEMKRLAMQYCFDLGELSSWDLIRFFNWVCKIPFQRDEDLLGTNKAEIVGRPRAWINFPRLDCKKKSILMGSWCFANKVPFEFLGTSELENNMIHHVLTRAKTKNGWIYMDPTLPGSFLGMPLPNVKYGEILA